MFDVDTSPIKSVIPSKVRHSERGYVISDFLVFTRLLAHYVQSFQTLNTISSSPLAGKATKFFWLSIIEKETLRINRFRLVTLTHLLKQFL